LFENNRYNTQSVYATKIIKEIKLYNTLVLPALLYGCGN